MSGDGKERGEALYRAWNGRDWDAFFALTDGDRLEWFPVEESSCYTGRAAVLEYFERWLSPWTAFRVEIERLEFTADERRMFAALRYVGGVGRSDATIEGRFFSVSDVRDCKFWRYREYEEESEAWADFTGPVDGAE